MSLNEVVEGELTDHLLDMRNRSLSRFSIYPDNLFETGPTEIFIEEKARELNVNIEVIQKLKLNNHHIIGDKIVSHNYLQKIKEEIGEEENYNKVAKIIAENHLSLSALDYIGYTIEWKGLIPLKITSSQK